MSEPMTTTEALAVADQVSPLPQVAHEALKALAVHTRRWLFWRDVIMSKGPLLRDTMRTLPAPNNAQELEVNIDRAIALTGWEVSDTEPAPVVDAWRPMDTAPENTTGVALLVEFTCCVPPGNRIVLTAGRQGGPWIAACEHQFRAHGWSPLPPIPAIPATAANLFATPTNTRKH